MKLTISINLDNSAFEDGSELRYCLEKVIKHFESNEEGSCNVYDSNGNKVGKAEIE